MRAGSVAGALAADTLNQGAGSVAGAIAEQVCINFRHRGSSNHLMILVLFNCCVSCEGSVRAKSKYLINENLSRIIKRLEEP